MLSYSHNSAPNSIETSSYAGVVEVTALNASLQFIRLQINCHSADNDLQTLISSTCIPSCFTKKNTNPERIEASSSSGERKRLRL